VRSAPRLAKESDRVSRKKGLRTTRGACFSSTGRRARECGDSSATFLVLQGIGEYVYVPLVWKEIKQEASSGNESCAAPEGR
jgi:hypothetical protein